MLDSRGTGTLAPRSLENQSVEEIEDVYKSHV
jgi:hypothetical protein